jgi:CBS domain-containing protein
MTITEIMTTDVRTCTPDTDLNLVAQIMLEEDCGLVPVVDRSGKTVGVVTDRDACMAVASHRRTLAHISAGEAMSHPVFGCFTEDTAKAALDTMAKHRVRRLPVLDHQGHLQGIVSMNDIVLAPRHRGAPTSDDIVEAMKAICTHRVLEPAPV